jgi:transposase
VASFAGGVAQAGYMARTRDLAPKRCLVVPVDVGKHAAMALVADHCGQIVREPFEFDLTASGARRFIAAVDVACRRASAQSVRVGIEAAGRYHRALAATLRGKGLDVVELNPYQVKIARVQLGAARIKTDPLTELPDGSSGWSVRPSAGVARFRPRDQGWGRAAGAGRVGGAAARVA